MDLANSWQGSITTPPHNPVQLSKLNLTFASEVIKSCVQEHPVCQEIVFILYKQRYTCTYSSYELTNAASLTGRM